MGQSSPRDLATWSYAHLLGIRRLVADRPRMGKPSSGQMPPTSRKQWMRSRNASGHSHLD